MKNEIKSLSLNISPNLQLVMRKIIYKIIGQPIDPKKGIRGTDSGKLYIDKKVFFQRDDVKETIKKIKEARALQAY